MIDAGCARAGAIGLGGGIVALVSHFALPVVVAPGVGAMTASDVVSQLGTAGSMSLAPVFALLAVGSGGWLYLGKPAPRRARWGGAALVVCGGLTIFAYLLPLGGLRDMVGLSDPSEMVQFMTFLSAGFWLVSLGVVAQIVGGFLVLLAARGAERPDV